MDFKKIKQAVKEVQFDTLRLDSDNNFEAVVVKGEMGKIIELFESFFGSPVFPSKNRLSKEILQAIASYGGIMSGQTLYYWRQGSATLFAMLWPWKDGEHTTVKIIKK